jgi:15-cis-phytoene synthase
VCLAPSSTNGEAVHEPEGLAPDQSTLAPGLRLLPTKIRGDVYRLYDVLRKLDDLVDDDRPEAAQHLDAVEAWTHGEPADTYETRILADLAQRHELPKPALLEFCQGMRHDIARVVIRTEEDLELYSQRAGGSVGIMLARVLGSTDPEAETKMATLGRAMQRTNILRDIDEDATHNRLYIAQSTIDRFGAPTPGARADLIRDQIASADALYEQARGATSMLASGQRGMALCTTLYREILRQIERTGYGHTPGRVIVPAWRRRLLIVKHCLRLDAHRTEPTPARP